MSLFKVAMVLSLGIAVMPSDEAQQKRLYQNAAAAAYWTATFCDRNGADLRHRLIAVGHVPEEGRIRGPACL